MFVVNDPNNDEPSYIKVITDNGKDLVYFHGPMSMFAAGAFIHMQNAKSIACINIANQYWKNRE